MAARPVVQEKRAGEGGAEEVADGATELDDGNRAAAEGAGLKGA